MLRLRLLGPMAADLDGTPVALPPSERARALMAWLALHPGEHSRAEVAAVLWPDAAPSAARASLRTAIWEVRRSCGDSAALRTGRNTVTLGPDGVVVDTALESGGDADPERLLPGLDEEWVRRARTRWADEQGRVLARLADGAHVSGDAAEAVRLSRLRCQLNPLDEGAHRELVDLLLAAGERAQAISEARTFARRLHDEVGVTPSPETRAVHARAQTGSRSGSAATLFGRGRELQALKAALQQAVTGHGQVVVISGEAGIGKTTLVGDLLHRAQAAGARCAVATGVDVGGGTPFGSWLDLAEGLARDARRVPSGQAWPVELNRLSADLGVGLGHPGTPSSAGAPELERIRVFDAVLRLVEWSCADRPCVLVLDDVHRADRVSLRLTAVVGRRVTHLPILLVLTRRTGVRRPEVEALLEDLAAHGAPVSRFDVGPLPDEAVAAVSRSLHRLDAEQLRQVVASSEGNPLLAVETTRALVQGSSGPPPSLRAAVTASIGRLGDDVHTLVQMVAVAGRPLRASEAERLVDRLGLEARDLVERSEGLLAWRDGRLGFRHELLRSAAYAGLGDAAAAHDLIAGVLDPEEHSEIGHHLAAAGRPQDAANAWARAARGARTVGALPEAAALLELAVSQRPSDAELWLELGEVYAWAGRWEESERAWSQALPLLAPERLAAAWCRRGLQFRTVICHPVQALTAYHRARDLLPPDAHPELVRDVLQGLAWGDAVAGSGAQFEQLLEQVSGVPAPPNSHASADALEIRMQGLMRAGRFAEAAAVARGREASLAASRSDRAYALFVNAACALVCVGDDEGALAMADRAVDATRDHGVIGINSLTARAQVLSRLGRHGEAMDLAEDIQARCDRLDAPRLSATARHDRGLVLLRAGRFEEAADLIAQALDTGVADVSLVSAGLARSEALALAGRAKDASAALRHSLLQPVGPADQAWALVPRVAWVQALVALAEGQRVEAMRRLDESEATWRSLAATARAATGQAYVGSLVDLGRPPVLGLVEPERELSRIDRLRQELAPREPVRS
jgi:DNA-binding SARP family transcriptional activator/tetratricopeptide (TPR) repeat protein